MFLSKETNFDQFYKKSLEVLKKIISSLNLKHIQLHGDENQSYIDEVKKQFNLKIVKKVSIKTTDELNKIKKHRNINYLLFDYKTKKNELHGENSKYFD